MKPPYFLRLIISALALILPLAFSSHASERPNVLFITIDDLNDWVSPLDGHPQTITPNFARLAARGVTFRNAHCTIPICSASRTSFMTGLYPERTGVFSNGNSFFDVDPAIQTIPEHMADNGYETFGAGKLFHGSSGRYTTYFGTYGPGTGNQGGPFTREELNTLNQNPTHEVDRGPGKLKAILPLNGMPDVRRDGRKGNNSFDWGPVDVSADEMPDGQIAKWAVDQLAAEAKRDQPFFLAAGFYRPHQPLFAPRKYFKPFDPEKIQLPDILSDDLDDMPAYAQKLARFALTAGIHQTVIDHDQWNDAVVAYLACVHFVDDQLGRIINALDHSPDASNTWIVLLSDHGYHLGEKEHWGKFTPWSESTRVPLMMVPPAGHDSKKWARGKSIDAPVSLLDIYPTLVELCGIEAPAHKLDGQNLAPLLQADSKQTASEHFSVTSCGRGTHSIVKGRHRYTQYFDGSEELYDLQADPGEFQNLAGMLQNAELKEHLKQHFPDDPEVDHFIRYDWKKIIFFKDAARDPILFEITPGTGGGGGIGETKDLSANYPEVLSKIQAHLKANPDLPQKLTLSAADFTLLNPPAGRLALVADGNSPDPDDIGATAVIFGILHNAGLNGRLVHLSHSCDLDPFRNKGRQKIDVPNELRRQQKLHALCREGISHFGPFDNLANYFNCRTDQEAAVNDLSNAINATTEANPLWIIEAGEPDIIGYALRASDASKHQHIHVISHHPANDNSGDYFEWADILKFGITEHQIGDQNVGLQTTIDQWDWARDHNEPGIAWIWENLNYAEQDGVVAFQENKFDCSDAGMIYWWITGADVSGNKTSTPAEMKQLLLKK